MESLPIQNFKTLNSHYTEEIDNVDNESISSTRSSLYQQKIRLAPVKVLPLSQIINKVLLDDRVVLVIKVFYYIDNKDPFTWELFKSYKQLRKLFKLLNRIINSQSLNFYLKRSLALNFFYLESLKADKLEGKEAMIIDVLNYILSFPELETSVIITEFLEISSFSFDNEAQRIKPKEGYILKRSRMNSNKTTWFKPILAKCCRWYTYWHRRWFILKDEMLSHLDSNNSIVGRDVFWFDQDTQILKYYEDIPKSIYLQNNFKHLILRFDDAFERDLWYQAISEKIKKIKKEETNVYGSFAPEKKGCYAKWIVDAHEYFAHLHDKLLEAKESIYITGWWVSPELFLKRPVSDEVNQDTKLMDVLKRKAEEGVKIYIMVYKEIGVAIPVNSAHTKHTLQNLHPNIYVTRRPKKDLKLLWSPHEKFVIIDSRMAYVGGCDLCWQRYDNYEHAVVEPPTEEKLYYWPYIDYSNPRLRDITRPEFWQNPVVFRDKEPRMPWHDVITYLEGPITGDLLKHFIQGWNTARNCTTKSVSTRIAVAEIKRQKPLRRTQTKFFYDPKDEGGFKKEDILQNHQKPTILQKMEEIIEEEDEDKIDNVNNGKGDNINNDDNNENKENIDINLVKNNNNNNLVKANNNGTTDMSNGSEIVNGGILGNNKKKAFLSGQFNKDFKKDLKPTFRTQSSMLLDNKNELITNSTTNEPIRKPTVLDFNKSQNDQFRKASTQILQPIQTKTSFNYPPVTKKVSFGNKLKKAFLNIFNLKPRKASGLGNRNVFLNLPGVTPSTYIPQLSPNVVNNMRVQVLRSACNWSIGLDNDVENSILRAYYDLIDTSQHYILIQNQFFMSKSYKDSENHRNGRKISKNKIVNQIALKIRERIIRAYNNNQKFRVFIFIPLVSAFPGEIYDNVSLQILLKYHTRTIIKNKGLSIIEKLYEVMGDQYMQYIHFFSLRNHGMINGLPVTEEIYIHAKCMIVDDLAVILGSANINDRSLLGDRDLEMNVVVREETKVHSMMNGKLFEASAYAKGLRIRLFKEHLGFDITNAEIPDVLDDPLSDVFYTVLLDTALNNTKIYREIFYCYPDDSLSWLKETFKANFSKKLEEIKVKYLELKDKIKGHIVDYPLYFLIEEDLDRPKFCKERLVPLKNFL